MTDLFAETTTTEPLFEDEEIQDLIVDPNKDWYSEYVGEGKRYQDEKALARAAAEKDAFIERLKRENAALRGESKAKTTLEELVDQLRRGPRETPNSDVTPQTNEQVSQKTFTPEEVQALIRQELDQQTKVRTQQQNIEQVKAKLQEAWGQDYVRKLEQTAKELGVGKDFLQDMAAKAPQAFLRTVGVQQATTPKDNPVDLFSNLPKPSVNTSMYKTGDGERRKSYYDRLLREDRQKYLSKEVQNEMHKQAMKLGPDFFDT